MDDKKARLSVRIEADLYQALRLVAFTESRTQRDIIEEALKKFFENRPIKNFPVSQW